MPELLPHLPMLPGERHRVGGTVDRCDECKHKWHGLPCLATDMCDCPSSYKEPVSLKET